LGPKTKSEISGGSSTIEYTRKFSPEDDFAKEIPELLYKDQLSTFPLLFSDLGEGFMVAKVVPSIDESTNKDPDFVVT
jgi:hypothetical protein